MNSDHDFSALQQLLALQRRDIPSDNNVDRFLIEFHRRQRAALLVPATPWSRLRAWLDIRFPNFSPVSSLSYAGAAAVIALTAFMGLTEQVQVTHDTASGQYRLSLNPPGEQSSFALMPASLTKAAAPKTDSLNFTPAASHVTPRFVLENSYAAYDANVAF